MPEGWHTSVVGWIFLEIRIEIVDNSTFSCQNPIIEISEVWGLLKVLPPILQLHVSFKESAHVLVHKIHQKKRKNEEKITCQERHKTTYSHLYRKELFCRIKPEIVFMRRKKKEKSFRSLHILELFKAIAILISYGNGLGRI